MPEELKQYKLELEAGHLYVNVEATCREEAAEAAKKVFSLEHRKQNAFENGDLGVLVTDPEGNICMVIVSGGGAE